MPGLFKELSDGLQRCMWAWKYVTGADAKWPSENSEF